MVRREVTGGMKRFFAAVMVLLSVVTLSGCSVLASLRLTFWDGLTKAEAREYIQNTLQEKYGEEFEVVSLGIRSGQYYRELVGTCSPKCEEDIFFRIEANNFGGSRILYDGYIQSLVRKEMKSNIDSVLAKYGDNFAAEVDVRGLSDSYDSGIYVAEDATIKKYSESLPDSNKTSIWIALNDVEGDINDVVNMIVADFYQTHAFIHFYYSNDDVINQCVEAINNDKSGNRLSVYNILYGHFPCDAFAYNGKENTLVQIEFANKS